MPKRDYEELDRIVSDIDDILVTNWIAPPVDPAGYRKAIAELVQFEIEVHRFFSKEHRRQKARRFMDFFLGLAKDESTDGRKDHRI